MIRLDETADRSILTIRWPPILQSGFRPFFLLAGIQASLFILLWIAGWTLGWPVQPGANPVLWHGHAMLFGFASAALAGFLLTAVPNWTEAGPVRGARLALLIAFWLAAQVLSLLPYPRVFAVADLGFWLLLIAFIAPGILRRNARRNGVFVVILSVLAGLDLLWHLSLRQNWPDAALTSLHAALGIYLLAIGIIGGRIIPAFTIGGLLQAGHPVSIVPAPRLGMIAVVALVAAVLGKIAGLPAPVQTGLFAAAAVLHGIRLHRWWRREILGLPIIWSLHLGYAFLPVGLALEAMAAQGLVPITAGIHALGSGAVGITILAVMTRASLGHTGRRLAAPRLATYAYLLVAGGALLRVIAATGAGDFTQPLLVGGGLMWAGGFAAFTAGYAGILTKPRVDGRPG
jgi:uncharacterized protein involved in response to NO